MWQPSAVLKEDCFVVDRDKLAKAPLPPMARVLVYGNSHLRQVRSKCQEPCLRNTMPSWRYLCVRAGERFARVMPVT